ncbi:MAG: hypothetical protein AAGJ17_03705 [Pseudomonadota bacterium]
MQALYDFFYEFVLPVGGTGAVISGLSYFLSKLIINRVNTEQNAVLKKELESIKAELSTAQISYEKQSDFVVSYYQLFYKHYRRCQDVIDMDLARHPKKGDIYSKDVYLDEIDDFAEAWGELEPRIRLILPQDVFDIHSEINMAINEFTRLVKSMTSRSKNMQDIEAQFIVIDKLKGRIELSLRRYLRAETVESHNRK